MTDLANKFAEKNHDVTVITPTSDFKIKSSLSNYTNLKIFTFRSFAIVNIGFFKRAINEMLLPILFLFAYISNSINKKRFDYIIWYSPSIFLSPIIWLLKIRFKAKTYLILRDIFPEWTLDLGLMKKGFIFNFFKLIALFQYKVADTVGIQSKSNFEIIKNKVNSTNVEVLNNWNSESEIADLNEDNIKLDLLENKKIITYIGNMGIAQDMYFLIDLAEKFQLNNFESIFLFVGRGTEVKNLKNEVKIRSLKNIKFFDEIPHKNVQSLLKKCSAGLISLDPRHKSHNIPGKFISYLQSGLPVIARINPNSDLEDLIIKNDVGIVYTDYNVNKFSEMINHMVNDENELKIKSLNARDLFLNNFETTSAYNQLISQMEL